VITAIRAELIKLRTTRLPYGLLALAAGLVALATILKAAGAGGSGHMAIEPLWTLTGQTKLFSSTDLAILLAGVFGVVVASGEFRHQTATTTYLANPNRVQVLAAKSAAGGLAGMVIGAVAGGVTTVIGASFVAAKGYPLLLSGGTIVRFIVGATLGAGLLAVAGVAVGSLIRGQLGAMIGIFLWGFVVEQIIGGLVDNAQPYLPYTAATALAGTPLGGGVTALPFAAAVALIAAIMGAVAVVAARTVVPADVT
jgi:ABC-2 type transport system permease protein